MLHSVKDIIGCHIIATDDQVGRVADVYLDDEKWVVRYLVVDTGGWLGGRKVLISPYAVRLIDEAARGIAITLSREELESSPDIDTSKPVSRRDEARFSRHFGYPTYWPYTSLWAWGAAPVVPAMQRPLEARELASHRARDPDESALRSAEEVLGYGIRAIDEAIGHAEDFLFEGETWAVTYLVVDTRKWLPGKHVLVHKGRIVTMDWLGRTLSLDLTREDIRSGPLYRRRQPLLSEPPAELRRYH